MYWYKSVFSASSYCNCLTWPRIIWGRGWSLLLNLSLSLRVVSLICWLSVVNYVALTAHSSGCLASSHSRHAHHSKVSSHAMIKKHTFEFSVGVKTQNYSNYVVSCEHAHNCKLKWSWGWTRTINATDAVCLNAVTNNIDEREKVDRNVDHVES